jgi:hypothetical protein
VLAKTLALYQVKHFLTISFAFTKHGHLLFFADLYESLLLVLPLFIQWFNFCSRVSIVIIYVIGTCAGLAPVDSLSILGIVGLP